MSGGPGSKASSWFSKWRRRRRSSSSDSSSSSAGSPVLSPGRSREDEMLRAVFRHFDRDGDGKVSAAELRDYFASMGEKMTESEAELAVADLDGDGDKLLDFDDFLRLMNRGKSSTGEEGEEEEEFRKAFEMYEAESGSGRITPRSLQRMLRRLGDVKSRNECAAMIRAYDSDGNGVLDFHEFRQMMTMTATAA